MFRQPTGNASAPLWAYDVGLERNVAEFVVQHGKVSGFGQRGGIWGAGATVAEPTGPAVKDRSEIWFDSVAVTHK
ncbi:hypothetical protein B0H19DRAFT_1135216 [Mycena capillaripes]|nr:hypothetical protein B0H19DRAFT_1135216 [Mycena capillaripes]